MAAPSSKARATQASPAPSTRATLAPEAKAWQPALLKIARLAFRLLTMRTNKHGRGRHPVEELRKKIGKMWDAGATQQEIADTLRVPNADVRYQLLKSGVPANLQDKP